MTIDVKATREAYGLTHKQLARILGCNASSIAKMQKNPESILRVYLRVLMAMSSGIGRIDTKQAGIQAKAALQDDADGLRAQYKLLSATLDGPKQVADMLPFWHPLSPRYKEKEEPRSVKDIAVEIVRSQVDSTPEVDALVNEHFEELISDEPLRLCPMVACGGRVPEGADTCGKHKLIRNSKGEPILLVEEQDFDIVD